MLFLHIKPGQEKVFFNQSRKQANRGFPKENLELENVAATEAYMKCVIDTA